MAANLLPILLGSAAATAAASAVASYATFVPGSRIWGPVIWQGPRTAPPRVALTFDDGPTAGPTERVLDLLASVNIKAAFFVIGQNVERQPELLRRIDADGHLIGNHTFDHSRWCSTYHESSWLEQMEKTDRAIEQVIGRRPRLFRPPIGHKTPYTLAAARRSDHVVVTWSVRAWDGIPTTADRIVRHVVPRSRAGTIVVLHDGAEPGAQRDASATLDALRPLVAELGERGLTPVRLDELIDVPPYAAAGVGTAAAPARGGAL